MCSNLWYAVMVKIRNGSLSFLLLKALEKSAEGLLFLDEFTYSAQHQALRGVPSKRKDKALVVSIRRLIDRGIITYEEEKEGKAILRLSELGINYLEGSNDVKWDGIYRIVVWDIPESRKNVRNLLRRRLRDWGFVGWQKSVWVSKRKVTQKLKSLINELGVENWVAVIESSDQSLGVLFKYKI